MSDYNDFVVRLEKNCFISFWQTGRENVYIPETPMDLSRNHLRRI